MQLGAIADDFTGATDLAIALHRRGFATLVSIEDAPLDPDVPAEIDAVVVALKTRTAPVDDAVRRTRAAVRGLQRLEPRQYYVKYCSTFDSTPRGNIGPILDAVLDELGEQRTIVVPAFPENGRTVYQGHLFVGSQLLAESPMRDHPLTPMTRSRLADLLAPQTGRPITEVPAQRVWQGADSLRETLAEHPRGHLIIDAVTDADLATITASTADWRVISGGAGLAVGMAGPRLSSGEPAFVAPPGRRLVLCGSASAMTKAQIEHAAGSLPTRKLDLDALASGREAAISNIIDWLSDLHPDDVPVIYSVGSASDIRPDSDHPAGEVAPSTLVEQAIAELARLSIAQLGFSRLIVAGGETSGAVVGELGIEQLRIGPQIAPGVCWTNATTDVGTEVALALKSGNFGQADLFTTAWEALTR